VDFLLNQITKAMDADKKVVIFSVAGLGRSSVLAALVLMKRNSISSEQAIKIVKEIRGNRAFESQIQLDYVQNYKFK
jgi:protein-tyrosine phosphatase